MRFHCSAKIRHMTVILLPNVQYQEISPGCALLVSKFTLIGQKWDLNKSFLVHLTWSTEVFFVSFLTHVEDYQSLIRVTLILLSIRSSRLAMLNRIRVKEHNLVCSLVLTFESQFSWKPVCLPWCQVTDKSLALLQARCLVPNSSFQSQFRVISDYIIYHEGAKC